MFDFSTSSASSHRWTLCWFRRTTPARPRPRRSRWAPGPRTSVGPFPGACFTFGLQSLFSNHNFGARFFQDVLTLSTSSRSTSISSCICAFKVSLFLVVNCKVFSTFAWRIKKLNIKLLFEVAGSKHRFETVRITMHSMTITNRNLRWLILMLTNWRAKNSEMIPVLNVILIYACEYSCMLP